MARLAGQKRYDEAAALLGRMRTLLAALLRARRLVATSAAELLVASRPVGRVGGRRDVAVVRRGLLVASARCDADQVEPAAARVARSPPEQGLADDEATAAGEADIVGRWLEGAGARVHHCEGTLASALAGGRTLHAASGRLG